MHFLIHAIWNFLHRRVKRSAYQWKEMLVLEMNFAKYPMIVIPRYDVTFLQNILEDKHKNIKMTQITKVVTSRNQTTAYSTLIN